MCCPSVVRITRLLEYMRRAGLPALNSRKKARIRAGESRLSREVSRPTAVGRISKADDVGRDNAHWEGVQTPIDVSYCLSVQISLTRLKYLDDTFPESRLSISFSLCAPRPAPWFGNKWALGINISVGVYYPARQTYGVTVDTTVLDAIGMWIA